MDKGTALDLEALPVRLQRADLGFNNNLGDARVRVEAAVAVGREVVGHDATEDKWRKGPACILLVQCHQQRVRI